jgi:hypothetical protein
MPAAVAAAVVAGAGAAAAVMDKSNTSTTREGVPSMPSMPSTAAAAAAVGAIMSTDVSMAAAEARTVDAISSQAAAAQRPIAKIDNDHDRGAVNAGAMMGAECKRWKRICSLQHMSITACCSFPRNSNKQHSLYSHGHIHATPAARGTGPIAAMREQSHHPRQIK